MAIYGGCLYTKKNNNMKNITFLKKQVAALRAIGEEKLAKQMEKRIEQINKSNAKAAEPADPVVMYFQEGRVYVQPPKVWGTKLYALKETMKGAAEGSAQWEGKYYEKTDPRRGLWSFKASEAIVDGLKGVLKSFFPGANLINDKGEAFAKL